MQTGLLRVEYLFGYRPTTSTMYKIILSGNFGKEPSLFKKSSVSLIYNLTTCAKDCRWKSKNADMCMGVILIKLQSGFVQIVLLCWCSPVRLLHFWGHLPWRTPLEDCFWMEIILYAIFNLFFLIKYTFEDFKISVLLSF